MKLPLYILALMFMVPVCFASGDTVAAGAKAQVWKTLIYDPAYVRLEYPSGDLPLLRGVCSDVAVRALRTAGKDLQVLIHEDMKVNFEKYPKNWGLKKPDPNIDHRRVPNIVTYYKYQKRTLPLPVKVENVQPGDLIAWVLPNNRPHIGVVSEIKKGKVLVVHNIGLGAREEAVLYDWPITAHIRPLD